MSQKKEKILIFDTTLRDGEQCPGATMTYEQKINLAKVIEELGVDIIEAGFPVASAGDFNAVKTIAQKSRNVTIAGLTRARKEDIHKTWEAVKHAESHRIHTFISTSPIHMMYKLQKEPKEVLELIKESVSYARSLCPDVEWSCEDGSRTEHDFLCQSVELAIASGATTINVPDTVGYTTPEEYAALIKMLYDRVPNIDKAVISVHCHNDLGLAVANSLSAVLQGARQIECTVNGVGERAGNAALEEVVMAIKTRHDFYPFETGVVTENITKASRLVSSVTGFLVQKNKAIVGQNAFAHASGIHQHGVLRNSETYEIMTPETVGLKESQIVLTKHSGRHAFKKRLEDLKIKNITDEQFEEAFTKFKDLADRKKEVFDEDVFALFDDTLFPNNNNIELVTAFGTFGTTGLASAVVEVNYEGERLRASGTGDGGVDAAFNAIYELFSWDFSLSDYTVRSVTRGTDALAEVRVTLDYKGRRVQGKGVDTDTVIASVKANVNALNKLLLIEDEVQNEEMRI